MSTKRISILVLTLLVLAGLLLSGCSTAKKPVPSQDPAPDPGITRSEDVADPENNKYQSQPADSDQAVKIANEADDVSGVAKAKVVVSGSTAYIGLYLDSNEPVDAQTVEENVREKITEENANIKSVYVSTDSEVVERISKVANGIADGKPSSTSKELGELEDFFRNSNQR